VSFDAMDADGNLDKPIGLGPLRTYLRPPQPDYVDALLARDPVRSSPTIRMSSHMASTGTSMSMKSPANCNHRGRWSGTND
jgi:hypothetical protein